MQYDLSENVLREFPCWGVLFCLDHVPERWILQRQVLPSNVIARRVFVQRRCRCGCEERMGAPELEGVRRLLEGAGEQWGSGAYDGIKGLRAGESVRVCMD